MPFIVHVCPVEGLRRKYMYSVVLVIVQCMIIIKIPLAARYSVKLISLQVSSDHYQLSVAVLTLLMFLFSSISTKTSVSKMLQGHYINTIT